MSFVQNFPFFSIVLCLICAVVSFVVPRQWGRRLSITLLLVNCALHASVLQFCYSHQISYRYMMGHYPAPWGNEIMAGILEPFMALLFSVVILLAVLGGQRYIYRDVMAEKQHLYWIMIDLTLVSLLALSYTNDIFTGYVFIEICTIASCGLLAIREGGRNLIAAVRYMVFALIGSGLFLIGVIYLYSITGHLLLPQLYETIQLLWAEGTYRFSLTVSIGLMVSGLAIKSGCFPFHFWMPDTYGRATPSSSGILSGTVSKAYIFLLIKIIYRAVGIEVFSATGVQNILLLFGIGGMIIGSISAIKAKQLSTMVAYSSAAQIGYIFMGLGMGTDMALLATLLQIINHAVTKPMLFLSSARLKEASGGLEDFPHLRGAGHRAPFSGVAFTVGALSMVGVPIFAGFIPKLYYAFGAFALSWAKWPVLLALAISTILNVLYFLYTSVAIWLPENREVSYAPITVTPVENLPLLLFAILNIVIGLGTAGIVTVLQSGMALFCQ